MNILFSNLSNEFPLLSSIITLDSLADELTKKNVQLNYLHHNVPSSGFIIFGYANTTDPEPINRLFDKYNSYSIKVSDFYKGIENNLFCYVFMYIEVTEIPSSTYFYVKVGNREISLGTQLTLNDVIPITIKRNPPA